MARPKPEDTNNLFVEALNAGKLDALVALYEVQATLMPSPGKLVTGTAAIRESLLGFLVGKPKMSLTSRLVALAGDLAVTSAQWELSMTGPDGKSAQMTGQSIEVVRRHPDGRWLYAIDLPFGAGAA
jgi:uncharacterized protein (TIGR02246 family)